MISCDGERLKISGDFLEVSAEVGCIIMGLYSEKNPDFVNYTMDCSVIASMALGEITEAERTLVYKDKTFNEGVNEVINSVKALRELTENIVENKKIERSS